MSTLDASIDLMFGGDERRFRLTLDQLFALEERRNAPISIIYRRLANESWLISDVQEVLRLGLIGAGMAPPEAKLLIERYAGVGRLADVSLTARSILAAALFSPRGAKLDEAIGSGKLAAEGDSSETMDVSPQPLATAPEPSSD